MSIGIFAGPQVLALVASVCGVLAGMPWYRGRLGVWVPAALAVLLSAVLGWVFGAVPPLSVDAWGTFQGCLIVCVPWSLVIRVWASAQLRREGAEPERSTQPPPQ